MFAAAFAYPCELLQDVREKPCQPDALALPLIADAAHAIVPVARADQRQSMEAGGGSLLNGPAAVLEYGRLIDRDRRLKIDLALLLS